MYHNIDSRFARNPPDRHAEHAMPRGSDPSRLMEPGPLDRFRIPGQRLSDALAMGLGIRNHTYDDADLDDFGQ